MSWVLLAILLLGIGIALAVALQRRAELGAMHGALRAREQTLRALSAGGDSALLQHPVVDLSRCLGCGTCVRSCPEEGVLELVHGQAMVVRGARCVGHAACERECPVGAITVTIANLAARDDVPALSSELESVTAPGVFLAGEVTAHALIKTAIEQGKAVAATVAGRIANAVEATDGDAHGDNDDDGDDDGDVLDLCIVGAGPAGLACSLEARERELRFVTIDQEEQPGGTVAKYPRQKLVMTQPVELPRFGRFNRTTYTKEELVEVWQRIAVEAELPIEGGCVFEGLERAPAGPPGNPSGSHWLVRTRSRTFAARNVCLALGRRGTPRRLGVPGEDLPKVAYALLDARSYQGRRVAVVGGGDSAVEAALALAEQAGNQVALVHRRASFPRLRGANAARLEAARQRGAVTLFAPAEVQAITSNAIELRRAVSGGQPEFLELENDEVFVMIGGAASAALLERSGVSCDPALRPAPEAAGEAGTGLVRALTAGFALTALALGFALWQLDYYALLPSERPLHAKHELLRPGRGLGLGLGAAATALVVVNLGYLLRRSARFPLRLGSLRAWMTCHVATGILALLCALLHGAMAPGDTVGGHAFAALCVLFASGAIGRYLYAYVPRAANGRELALHEVKARLSALGAGAEGRRARFAERAEQQVRELCEGRQWQSSLPGRLLALCGLSRDLRRTLARLEHEGQSEGIAREELDQTLNLTRAAGRAALVVAHYEDLRGLLSSWRWLHRWVAALLVLLVAVHIGSALLFGSFDAPVPRSEPARVVLGQEAP